MLNSQSQFFFLLRPNVDVRAAGPPSHQQALSSMSREFFLLLVTNKDLKQSRSIVCLPVIKSRHIPAPPSSRRHFLPTLDHRFQWIPILKVR